MDTLTHHFLQNLGHGHGNDMFIKTYMFLNIYHEENLNSISLFINMLKKRSLMYFDLKFIILSYISIYHVLQVFERA